MISHSFAGSAKRYIKVMFKRISRAPDDIEVIKIDRDILEQLVSEVHRLHDYMVGTTSMGEWDIGYLPRG